MILIEFLTERLNEDEQWALAASAPYRYAVGNPPVPEGGVHWTWVVGENWTPVTPDPVTDEFIENDGEWSCNLATVEEWQSGVGNWMMRRSYAGTIQEMDPSAAGHIARHDPARALRQVEAGRRVVEAYESECEHRDRSAALHDRTNNRADGIEAISYAHGAGVKELAMVYSDHEDYQEGWKP